MANKSKIVSKEEALMTIEVHAQEQRVKARRKEVIRRINSLMKDANLVRVSKDGKRWFYQACFEKEFAVNKGTTSLYYAYDRDIPLETLLAIFNHSKIKCSLDYLLLRSDAVNYEFDAVVKKTGLTEEAVEKLIMYKDIDRVRADDYSRLAESAKKKKAIPNRPKPIPKGDIISEMITHDKFASVVSTLEVIASEMPKEAKGHFADYKEIHDSRIYSLMKNLEAILLDCIDESIEDEPIEEEE